MFVCAGASSLSEGLANGTVLVTAILLPMSQVCVLLLYVCFHFDL